MIIDIDTLLTIHHSLNMHAIIIADDFSGAAELAGISLRYGLSTEIFFGEFEKESKKKVLIFCTDSRSKSLREALAANGNATLSAKKFRPKLFFKKIDSVLRGHFVEEIAQQLTMLDRQTALVVPANPTMGRFINGKKYFIGDKAINETNFATDPEFPVLEADIEKRFENKVYVAGDAKIIKDGINVAEVSNTRDLQRWASADRSWLLAGAGDFYEVLLQRNFSKKQTKAPEIHLPHLYVCGTTHAETKAAINRVVARGFVSYLKADASDTAGNEKLVGEMLQKINRFEKLILAVDEEEASDANASQIRENMAAIVGSFLRKEKIRELFIDGGSTAGAILEELGIKSVEVAGEFQRGVVQMKHGGLFITVKPGSFELPATIKKLYHLDL